MVRTWARLAAGGALGVALALAAAPPARAGTTATAGHADKSLTVQGFAQMRWEYDHIGARGDITPRTETNSFRLRRLRLRMTGDWNQYFRVRLQLALQEFARLFGNQLTLTRGGNVLEDAYLQFKPSDKATFLFGQYKLPISREELRSSSDQLVVDRSPIVNANFTRSFWISRDVGLMVQGDLNGQDIPLAYYAGIWNGEGRNGPLDFIDLNTAKLFGGRAEYSILPGVEVGGSYLTNPIYAGAGLYSYGTSSFSIPEDADYREFASVWDVDGNFTRQFSDSRLIVEGEVLQGTNTRLFAASMRAALEDSTTLPRPGDDGFTQRGMQIAGNMLFHRSGLLTGWEIGARLADFDPDIDTSDDSDTELAVAVGLHFLDEPEANKDRLQLEFTNIFHERESVEDDWIVKVQWQVRY